MAENVTVSIEADTEPFLTALDNLQALSGRFGAQLTGALRSAVVDGKELDTVLRRLALNLAGTALSQGLQPLQGLVGSLLSSAAGGLAGILPFAKGGVVPFASGGVVSAPTYFPAGGRLGLMGEAGAEAILPLEARRRRPARRVGRRLEPAGQHRLQRDDAGRRLLPEIGSSAHRNAGKGGIARDADILIFPHRRAAR